MACLVRQAGLHFNEHHGAVVDGHQIEFTTSRTRSLAAGHDAITKTFKIPSRGPLAALTEGQRRSDARPKSSDGTWQSHSKSEIRISCFEFREALFSTVVLLALTL